MNFMKFLSPLFEFLRKYVFDMTLYKRKRMQRVMNDFFEDLHYKNKKGKKYTYDQIRSMLQKLRFMVFFKPYISDCYVTTCTKEVNGKAFLREGLFVQNRMGDAYLYFYNELEAFPADESEYRPLEESPNFSDKVVYLKKTGLGVIMTLDGEFYEYQPGIGSASVEELPKVKYSKVLDCRPDRKTYAALGVIFVMLGLVWFLNRPAVQRFVITSWQKYVHKPVRENVPRKPLPEIKFAEHPVLTIQTKGLVAASSSGVKLPQQVVGNADTLKGHGKDLKSKTMVLVALMDIDAKAGEAYMAELSQWLATQKFRADYPPLMNYQEILKLYDGGVKKHLENAKKHQGKLVAFAKFYGDFFATLALTPKGHDNRADFLKSLQTQLSPLMFMMIFLVAVIGLGVPTGAFWFFLMVRTERPKMRPSSCGPNHIHALVSGIWYLYFAVGSMATWIASQYLPKHSVLMSALMMMSSVAVLYYLPRAFGMSRKQINKDSGFTLIDGSWMKTIKKGVVAFIMTLPFVVAGMAVSAYLNAKGGSSGGAPQMQPIMETLLRTNDVYLIFTLFVAAGVAAGFTEEPGLRGGIFKWLYDVFHSFMSTVAARRTAILISALTTTGIMSFVFAIMHPGLIGLPQLFLIAVSWSFIRFHWDSVIPNMIAHNIQNTATLCMALFVTKIIFLG